MSYKWNGYKSFVEIDLKHFAERVLMCYQSSLSAKVQALERKYNASDNALSLSYNEGNNDAIALVLELLEENKL